MMGCPRFGFLVIVVIVLLGVSLISVHVEAYQSADSPIHWTHLSTSSGDLELPGVATEQTASLIADIDGDGVEDIVIGSRRDVESLVWYRRETDSWTRYVIEDEALQVEAGGAFYDLDRDGDLDIVMGGDSESNQVWWWENPSPAYEQNTPWQRWLIKNSGPNMHHDQIFGDFDGDGADEFVFWNQVGFNKPDEGSLHIAEIPEDPQTNEPWPYDTLFPESGEALAKADMDGDGTLDLLGGGHWFQHQEGTGFIAHVIDDQQRHSRIAVGDLIKGGRLEVVMVAGDSVGPLVLYECAGDPTDPNCWTGRDLLGRDVHHGHSLEVADVNQDGNLDIFVAEMRLDDNDDATMWLFLGDGQGGLTETMIATGFDNHESRMGDLDGDGDLDILGKPYDWQTPRLDVWINNVVSQDTTTVADEGRCSLWQWQRHVIDSQKPWRTVFVFSADVDADGREDVLTGGWWYKNPGRIGDAWVRNLIGAPLNNVAAVHDFDDDGDVDMLGTTGQVTGNEFVWASNNGDGSFNLLSNIPGGEGDFLQGVAVERFSGGNSEVALSWHADSSQIQYLSVPPDPVNETWTLGQLAAVTQNEALSAGDIDGDGRTDLLLGTRWLRNNGRQWLPYMMSDDEGQPDRNLLVDINNDGRLDALVGFEAIGIPGKLAWYETGSRVTQPWNEHHFATVIGPMSLGAADMDGDGDLDVIVGEHSTENPENARLLIFENSDGGGDSWPVHQVFKGDEHHDGAQVTDLDGDGDLDILSIGWTHNRVLVYENLATQDNPACGSAPAEGSLTSYPAFTWSSVAGAECYQIQIDNNADFSSPIQEATVVGATQYNADPLADGQYYWRVRVGGNCLGVISNAWGRSCAFAVSADDEFDDCNA